MSNKLTGEYDAVVQVEVEAINRLIATVHQRGASDDAHPKFLHSFKTRVGETLKVPEFELAKLFILDSLDLDGGAVDFAGIEDAVLETIGQHLVDAQQAWGKVLEDLANVSGLGAAEAGLVDVISGLANIAVVRGTAQVQTGSPTVDLAPNSTSEVTVRVGVRARYTPDVGTVEMPAPIHGYVNAAFTVHYNASGTNGTPALEIQLAAEKNKVSFLPGPGTGLTVVDAKRIAKQIRRVLATKFEPMKVDLPPDFPFRQFKCLVAGNTQVVALPIEVSGQVGAFDLNGVTNLFLEPGDDYGIAVSEQHIGEALKPALHQLDDFDYKIKTSFLGATVFRLHAWVSSVTVGCESGALVVTIKGTLKVWTVLTDDEYHFTVTQKLGLSLDVPSQTLTLVKNGGVAISGLPAIYKALAQTKIGAARDAALASAQTAVADVLGDITLGDHLETFDSGAEAKYTAVDIEPAGVILRGRLTMSTRAPVVVSVAETAGGTALTAFKSWVPAGTVDDYVWSWVVPDTAHPFLPFTGLVKTKSTPHDFVFSRPTYRGQPIGQVCVAVSGTRSPSGWGGTEVVAGPDETVCQVEKPEWVAVTPPWWADILMVPVWGPDPGPERILEEAVVAHINVRPADAVSPGAATASILHFTGNGMAAPLPPLGDAVARSRHRDAAIPAIVVLPTGSFHQTSAALQERLGSAEGLAGPLVVTEDYQGHWSRAFQPPEGPATYLVSAGGELVWQQQGPVDPASLGAALDEHATAGARRQSVLVRPGVRVGEPAPEALLEDGAAAELLGVRLGQGPVRLLFWKAWSHPCLAELRHLQRLHAGWAGGGPVILGIGDGEDARAVEEIARRHDLGFRLVADPDRRIARQFHINCWPTTLDIDGAGFVQSIHLGMTPEHGGAATVAAARRA